jgi:RNA polymerase sigma-70 factor (ECF subfamily)
MAADLSDAAFTERLRAGDLKSFEEVMREYNQRIYRVTRAIVQDDAAAEDVMQQAYIQAFTHLDQFSGRSHLSTWLTRIAIREAIAYRRKTAQRARREDSTRGETMSDIRTHLPDPEAQAYAAELKRLME